MRIGTWNLEGRWGSPHHSLLTSHGVDVWLLTEVSESTEIDGYSGHLDVAAMAAGRRWAGVFSRRRIEKLPDPHPASALARVDGVTFCSSILPWKGAWPGEPWVGDTHAQKAAHTVQALLSALSAAELVWGGDWNHALEGPEWAGSNAGRTEVLDALSRLDLQVPTATAPHWKPGMLSIDHIAIPNAWETVSCERVVAESDESRLSDHDAYVVEVRRPSDGQSQLSQAPVSASS